MISLKSQFEDFFVFFINKQLTNNYLFLYKLNKKEKNYFKKNVIYTLTIRGVKKYERCFYRKISWSYKKI